MGGRIFCYATRAHRTGSQASFIGEVFQGWIDVQEYFDDELVEKRNVLQIVLHYCGMASSLRCFRQVATGNSYIRCND